MRVVVKVILIIVVFMIFAVIQIALKGGDSNRPGVGGPVGIIFLFAFLAAARAIWKYNPDKEADSLSDQHNLDKS